MSVRRGDQRLAETLRNLEGAPVRIKEAAPEMAELDRVEMIDVFQKSFADRAAENVKRMGRDRKERRSTVISQAGKIIQRAERGNLVRRDIQQNHVGAFETNLGSRNQKDA